MKGTMRMRYAYFPVNLTKRWLVGSPHQTMGLADAAKDQLENENPHFSYGIAKVIWWEEQHG